MTFQIWPSSALRKQTAKAIQSHHSDRIGEQGNTFDFMYNHRASNKGHLVTYRFETLGTPGMDQQAYVDIILKLADSVLQFPE